MTFSAAVAERRGQKGAVIPEFNLADMLIYNHRKWPIKQINIDYFSLRGRTISESSHAIMQ